MAIDCDMIVCDDSTENKNNPVHNVQESGDTFKAKGETGGDVVRKGKPDPYAFIQLNPKVKYFILSWICGIKQFINSFVLNFQRL